MAGTRRLLGAVALGVLGATVLQAQAEVPFRESVRHVANVPGSTGGHAVVQGDRLYVGAYGVGMRVFDIKDPAAPVETGRYLPGPQPGQPDNDLGARADAVPDAAVLDGRHIVTLNGTGRTPATQQTEFVDWTDPAAPRLLWRFTDGTDGEAHNGDIIDARRLWVPSGSSGTGQLRLYDLNPVLQTPPAAPKRLSSSNLVTLWQQSPFRAGRPVGATTTTSIHDIEIYVDREVLLPASAWVDRDGDGTPDKTYAKKDIALVAEGGSYTNDAGNSGSLFVVDITVPAKPVVLLRYQRPAGLRQPVRYVHEAQFLDGSPDVLVTTDEDLHNGCDKGGLTVHRVSEDLTQITELSQWFIGTGTPAAVCSTHVMSTKDQYAFIGSYNAGLQVVDLSDPARPVDAGQYIAEGANSWGALVHPDAPGYLTYVGDFGGRGLDVFEFIPDAVAEGLVASNPAITRASGLNETACENGQPTAPTVDALVVPVPAAQRGGDFAISALGSGVQPYDLNVYFYGAGCVFMGGTSINGAEKDAAGQIPEGAHFAVVANVLGGPTYTFVTTRSNPLPAEDGQE